MIRPFFLFLAEILQVECHNYCLFLSLLFEEIRLFRLNLKGVSSSQWYTKLLHRQIQIVEEHNP